MVDFQTQAKHHGYKYNCPEVKEPVPHMREFNRSLEPLIFSTPREQVHDCRKEVSQDIADPKLWDAFIMSSGIKKTYDAVNNLHHKPKEDPEDKNKKPDKLLFDSGEKGSAPGKFNYPRGLAVGENGDIVVADSLNHRVQILNQCALLKEHFGKKGKGEGEFNLPSDVAVMTNGRIVVADTKNKRIQVFSEAGVFKYMFPTKDEPCHVACDRSYNIIVSTMKRTIEVYRRQGALRHKFSLEPSGNSLCAPIVTNNNDQVIVCDLADGSIKFYTYKGQFIREFRPTSDTDGIACDPCGLAVNPLGQILVSDGLNHCINVYSDTGEYLSQALKPTDDIGAASCCTVGPEGHLIVNEFSSNGRHCVKVFRYRDCDCHRTRPGSSRRQSRPSTPREARPRSASPDK